MSKKNNPYGEGLRKYKLTTKGAAYYLAVKHGLCPEVEGGYDTQKFDKFWDEFEFSILDKSPENDKKCLHYGNRGGNNSESRSKSVLLFTLGYSIALFLCILKSICA